MCSHNLSAHLDQKKIVLQFKFIFFMDSGSTELHSYRKRRLRMRTQCKYSPLQHRILPKHHGNNLCPLTNVNHMLHILPYCKALHFATSPPKLLYLCPRHHVRRAEQSPHDFLAYTSFYGVHVEQKRILKHSNICFYHIH